MNLKFMNFIIASFKVNFLWNKKHSRVIFSGKLRYYIKITIACVAHDERINPVDYCLRTWANGVRRDAKLCVALV